MTTAQTTSDHYDPAPGAATAYDTPLGITNPPIDELLDRVSSKYALVIYAAKRARQITLWLTADPAELRAESAPPPAAGELVTRDPVALSEAEILQGEVLVKWDPEGRGEELGDGSTTVDELDESILLESLNDDDDDADLNGEDGTEVMKMTWLS